MARDKVKRPSQFIAYGAMSADAASAWLLAASLAGECVNNSMRGAAHHYRIHLDEDETRRLSNVLHVQTLPTAAHARLQAALDYYGSFQNVLSTESLSRGAGTKPEGFQLGWSLARDSRTAMLDAATVVFEPGNPVRQAVVDDPSIEGEIISGEAVINTATDVTFGGREWNKRVHHSKHIIAPMELVEDAPLFAEQIGLVLGRRVKRSQNKTFTNGNGGVVAGATLCAAAGTGDITTDDLENLIGTIEGDYLDGAEFQMHTTIYKLLRKKKDGHGRPLFTLTGNGRKMLLDWPVRFNNHLPATMASGETSILFGHFREGFKIVADDTIRLARFDEARIEYGQILFSAFQAADGVVMQPTAIAKLTH